jgi:hypothetical protein
MDKTPAPSNSDSQNGVALPEPAAPAADADEGAERRASPRRRKQRMVLVANADGAQDPYRGWVMDRSLGGLCLSVDHPIEPGTVLRVRPSSAPARTPWVEVKVKHCNQKEATWELGCEFVRTPSCDVLLLFG